MKKDPGVAKNQGAAAATADNSECPRLYNRGGMHHALPLFQVLKPQADYNLGVSKFQLKYDPLH